MSERDVHFIPAQMSREEWQKVDKIPYRGELLIETDRGGRIKIGDGLRPFRDLPYFTSADGLEYGVIIGDGIDRVIVLGPDQTIESVPNNSLIITQDEITDGGSNA